MCDASKSTYFFYNPDHKGIALDRIHTLYLQHRLCDVIIVVNNNQKYQVHGLVLSSVSEYFQYKLDENFGTQSPKEIPINNIDDEAVKRMLEYCYTGKIEFSSTTVLEVLNVAGLFQLEPVVKACCEFMATIINIENCLKFDETVNLFGCSSLGNKVTDFILINYKRVCQTDEFLKISIERLLRLLQMNLNVSSEREVLNSVKAWISHDIPNRKKYTPSLLKLIKLPSFTQKEILGIRQLCDGVPNCEQLIFSALEWKITPNRNINEGVNWGEIRTAINTIIVTGGLKSESNSIIEIYNPKNDTWHRFLDTSITRKNANYVLIDDELIIIGGQEEKVYSAVESVNLKTGKKVVLPPLQEARMSSVSAVIGNVIYVFGGNNESKTINSVEKWDPVTKIWSFSTPMTVGRFGCGIAVLDNEIYVIGGSTKFSGLDEIGVNTVEAYCPLSGKWKTCAPLNEIRHWVSATSVGNKIYVLGGRKQNSPVSQRYKSVECYDKSTDSWSFIADITNSRYGVASGVLGIDLVVVGGADLANWNFNAVEKYNENLNKWISLAPVNEKRENSFVFSVPISWLERKITLN